MTLRAQGRPRTDCKLIAKSAPQERDPDELSVRVHWLRPAFLRVRSLGCSHAVTLTILLPRLFLLKLTGLRALFFLLPLFFLHSFFSPHPTSPRTSPHLTPHPSPLTPHPSPLTNHPAPHPAPHSTYLTPRLTPHR